MKSILFAIICIVAINATACKQEITLPIKQKTSPTNVFIRPVGIDNDNTKTEGTICVVKI